MSKFLKIILYPIFFAFCFFLFFILLFPFDSLKYRVAREMEQAVGGDYRISIHGMSPSPLSGIVLKDVEIRPPDYTPEMTPIKIERAKLKFSLLALLAGNTEVDFDIKLAQGKATGAFAWKKTSMLLNLKMDKFDLNVISFLTQKSGIPVSGIVSGDVNLDLYPQEPLKNSGKIALRFLDLGFGEMNFANGSFALPAIKLAQEGNADSHLDIDITRGNFEVKAFQLAGADLSLDTNGKIYGARKADNFRFNLKGNFKVTPELAGKVQILGLVEKQKAADGSYPFTITGRISKPSIRIGEFKLPI